MKPAGLLRIFRQTGALLKGHFQLRSGLHSGEYFQCALLLQHPRIAGRLCRALVAKLRASVGDRLAVDGVISPALGGILVGQEIARVLGVRAIFAEKEEGKLVLRRGFRIGAGERFIVAEDVVTRGGRVQETIDIVEKAGGKAVHVLVLVDRSGGRASFSCPLHSLVEMEPVTFEPDKCPLCAGGEPMHHPGS